MTDEDVFPAVDRILAANAELVALVDRYLPQRVYAREPRSRAYAAAAIVRMAETVEAIMLLLPEHRDTDANVLLRSLYEQAVTFMWVAIDPEENLGLLFGDAEKQRLKLHRDVTRFAEGFLSAAEIEHARAVRGMPPLTERAEAVDRELTREVPGMHAANHIFSIRGLYAAVYRLASRATHGSADALDPHVEREGLRLIIQRPGPESHTRMPYALVAPIFTMALIVASGRFFNWLDEAEIRAINAYGVALPRHARPNGENEVNMNDDEALAGRLRRAEAASRYRPKRIKLLLIAEAPPSTLDRYFYFDAVGKGDSLFRYVARGILAIEPTRGNKAELLARLQQEGVFLIDLLEDPKADTPLNKAAPHLVRRVKSLAPERIILIKTTVYDTAYPLLKAAELPVIAERIPFPGSGQQRRFEEAFRRALTSVP